MAIAWITELRNNHPTATLSILVDDGRHPSVDDVEYDRNSWINIAPRRGNDDPTIVKPSNLAVPWSFGGANKMLLRVETTGGRNTASAEIRGTDGWDYIVLRDVELNELKSIEAGSLGDAPGVNHSKWAISLHENGVIEWHLWDRQGARRADILNAVNEAGSFFMVILPEMIKTAGSIAELAAKAA